MPKPNHYAHVVSKKDRKFQSKQYRSNPNHQEANRQAHHQRYHAASVNISSEISFITTLLFFGLLITPIAATQIKNVSFSISEENSHHSLEVFSSNTTTISSPHQNATKTVTFPNATIFHFFNESKVEIPSHHFPRKENKHEEITWSLDKILNNDDLKKFKDYIKQGNDIFQGNLLIHASGQTYYPYKIWSYLLNKSKEGGFKILEKAPKLFLFHVFREARKNYNDELLYILYESDVLEETKFGLAMLNNIEKTIRQNNILKLDTFLNIYQVARDIFADTILEKELLEFSKNSNGEMRNYVSHVLAKGKEDKMNNENSSPPLKRFS